MNWRDIRSGLMAAGVCGVLMMFAISPVAYRVLVGFWLAVLICFLVTLDWNPNQ